MKMKKKVWVLLLQTAANIIAAILTALGVTSCMGFGPVNW